MIASIVGATGLIGRDLVLQLCRDADFDAIHVFVRRKRHDAEAWSSPKLIEHVIDFDQLAHIGWPRCDVLFCCLGTTIKAAGSKAAFRNVDYDYVVASAYRARQAGATSLVVVSAVGANRTSRIFYNRTKGEMEATVSALGFESVSIVRPSMLDGARTELRAGERLALVVARMVNPILPARYCPVSSQSVAAAMIAIAKKQSHGATIIESDQIARLA